MAGNLAEDLANKGIDKLNKEDGEEENENND